MGFLQGLLGDDATGEAVSTIPALVTVRPSPALCPVPATPPTAPVAETSATPSYWHGEQEARTVLAHLQAELQTIAHREYGGEFPAHVQACVITCTEAAEEILSRIPWELSHGWDPLTSTKSLARMAVKIAKENVGKKTAGVLPTG